MRRRLLCYVAMIGVLAICAPIASATMQLTLTISSGASSQTFTSSGPVVSCSMCTFGNWTLTFNTGITASNNPILHLNSVDFLGTGGGSGSNALSIKMVAQGYTLAPSTFISTIGGTLGANQSLAYSAYVDPTNGGGTPASGLIYSQSFANPSGTVSLGFNGTGSGGAALTAPYSLTELATLSGTTAFTSSSFDATVDAIPEPTTVALLGGVLLVTFGTLRRKIRQN